jgi:hypothetical protein
MQQLLQDGLVDEAEEQLALAHAAQPDKVLYVSSLADCIAHSQQQYERSLPWFEVAITLDASIAQVL